VPLARPAQVPRVTWLVRTALAQREATKALAMRTLHALRPVLPAVCAARGLRPGSWPYLAVDELADPCLPADTLQRRTDRRADECAAALARPAAPPGAAAGTAPADGQGGLRGLGVCPGRVEGRVVRLGGGAPVRRDGTPLVLVCERADVDIHHLLSIVDAVVTARGSALSHVAILLREYGIPSVVGHPIAAGLRDGQLVRVDGTTGEVSVSDR
jgi:rifampicin phosphotransferase